MRTKKSILFGCASFLIQQKAFVFGGLMVLTVSAAANGLQQWVVVSNPTALERPGEVVAIKRALLGKTDSHLFVQVKKGGKTLISQTTDNNGDGIWDELLVEINLAPHAKDTLLIEWTQKKPAFQSVTAVRLSLRSDTKLPSPEITKEIRLRGFTQNIAKPYYQMEGPGIENDKVAFRAFFDARNSKDIYGKRVDTPVLEGVGVGASWHDLQPWGMDIFHTGNSLGAGGLAVEEENKIYRLGDADTSTFQALYKGPLAAAFRLNFKGWDVAKQKGDGSETIAVAKGTFYYRNEIELNLNALQYLIAGMANFGIGHVVYKKHNPVFSSVSTYGPQAEGTNTRLGVALLFPAADYVKHGTADSASSIPNTTYVELKPSAGGKKTIYFFACWEKTDSRFSTHEGFQKYLQASAQALAAPVQIKRITQKQL